MYKLLTILTLLIFGALTADAQTDDRPPLPPPPSYDQERETGFDRPAASIINTGLGGKDFFASVHLGAGVPLGRFSDGIDYVVTFTSPEFTIPRQPTIGLDLALNFDKFFSANFGFSTTVGYLRFARSEDEIGTSIDLNDGGYHLVHGSFGMIARYTLSDEFEVYGRVQGGISQMWMAPLDFSFEALAGGSPPQVVDVEVDVTGSRDLAALISVSGGVRYLISRSIAIGGELTYRHSTPFRLDGPETEVVVGGAPITTQPLTSPRVETVFQSVGVHLVLSYGF